MKNLIIALIGLFFLASCESAKNINLKNIRKECPDERKLTDILCKEKK